MPNHFIPWLILGSPGATLLKPFSRCCERFTWGSSAIHEEPQCQNLLVLLRNKKYTVRNDVCELFLGLACLLSPVGYTHTPCTLRAETPPSTAAHMVSEGAQDTAGFLGCQCTVLGHCGLLINQHTQVLLLQDAVNLFSTCSIPGCACGRALLQLSPPALLCSSRKCERKLAGKQTSLSSGDHKVQSSLKIWLLVPSLFRF